MSQLFIFAGATLQWRNVDLSSRQLLASGTGYDGLARFAGQDAVLVLPGEQVLLQQLELPKKAKAANLAWLIEAQLFVDLEQQYWQDCGGTRRQRTLAIVEQQLLDQWRQSLQEQQIGVQAILPDSWLLPCDDDRLCIVQQDERLILATQHRQGWAIQPGLAATLCEQLAPSRIEAWGLDDQQRLIWGAQGMLMEHSLPDDLYFWMALHWRGDTGLITRRKERSLRPALPTLRVSKGFAWAAPLLCAVLLSSWLDYQQLQRQERALQQQLQHSLAQLPGLQGLTLAQLERQLLQVDVAPAESLVKAQLTYLSGVIKQLPAHQLQALEVDDKGLLVTLDSEAGVLQELGDYLRSLNYQVHLDAGAKTLLIGGGHAG